MIDNGVSSWEVRSGHTMDPEGPSSSEEGKSGKVTGMHHFTHYLADLCDFGGDPFLFFLFRDELPSGDKIDLQSGIWERIVEGSLLVSTHDGLSGVCNKDRGEPAVGYR